MRTIKFRGKSINTGEWVYGYFKKNRHGDCYIENDGLTIVVDPETVSQLVDICEDGSEIYEGDYIYDADDEIIMRVEWDEAGLRFVAVDVYPTAEGRMVDGVEFPLGEVDIIPTAGNIWDNEPEDFYKEEE